jgi:hypothetical protein
MPWIYIWFALAMLEAALILWLVALVLRVRDEASGHIKARSEASESARHWWGRYASASVGRSRARRALEAIADLDTPKAAHGVKKAVAIAKEALEQ